MRRTAGSATLLRIVGHTEEAPEIAAAHDSYMERALRARVEDLPGLLRSFEKQASREAGNSDLAEAILHLGEVTRALASSRPIPEEAPGSPGRAKLVLVGLAAGLVTVGATLLVEGGALADRTAVAAAAPSPSPGRLPDAPSVALSRGRPISANALAILGKFPQGSPGQAAASGACARSNEVMFASRALATRIAEPLLRADEVGKGAPEADASNWNTLIFMARLLRNAERAQIGARAAGCA